MDAPSLVAALALATLLAVAIFALVSKKKVDQRRRDPARPKSTLAADAPSRKAP